MSSSVSPPANRNRPTSSSPAPQIEKPYRLLDVQGNRRNSTPDRRASFLLVSSTTAPPRRLAYSLTSRIEMSAAVASCATHGMTTLSPGFTLKPPCSASNKRIGVSTCEFLPDRAPDTSVSSTNGRPG